MATVDEKAALELVIFPHRLLRTMRRAGLVRRIPPTQLIVLAPLNQFGPSRIGVTAERIRCFQPTATAVVASLESAGLVQRESTPSITSATRAVLTPPGCQALRACFRSGC